MSDLDLRWIEFGLSLRIDRIWFTNQAAICHAPVIEPMSRVRASLTATSAEVFPGESDGAEVPERFVVSTWFEYVLTADAAHPAYEPLKDIVADDEEPSFGSVFFQISVAYHATNVSLRGQLKRDDVTGVIVTHTMGTLTPVARAHAARVSHDFTWPALPYPHALIAPPEDVTWVDG